MKHIFVIECTKLIFCHKKLRQPRDCWWNTVLSLIGVAVNVMRNFRDARLLVTKTFCDKTILGIMQWRNLLPLNENLISVTKIFVIEGLFCCSVGCQDINSTIVTYLLHFLPCRRTVVSIPNGPSELAVKEAAWGLARYAAISQVWKLIHTSSYLSNTCWCVRNVGVWSRRTTGWSRLLSLRFCLMVSTGLIGHSKLHKRCGPRSSST